MSLFDGQTLNEMINSGTPSAVVNKVSSLMLLGNVLGTLGRFAFFDFDIGTKSYPSVKTSAGVFLSN